MKNATLPDMHVDVSEDPLHRGMASMPQAALVGISHGTASPPGQAVVRQVADTIGLELRRRGGVMLNSAAAFAAPRPGSAKDAPAVHLGHVDVQAPNVPTILDELPEAGAGVIVPLLLSTGFHVNVDLREAVAQSPRRLAIADALGPDHRLTELLVQRLAEAGANPDRDVIIMGAAGSSDSAGVRACREMGSRLAAYIGVPVITAFLSAAWPSVDHAIRAARVRYPGKRVVAASYLLAPGYFHGLLRSCGADLTTEPLLAPNRAAAPSQIVDIVLDRYQEGLARLPHTALARSGVSS